MSKLNEIKDWLAIPELERDYFTGIALYQKYGDNPRLKNLVFTSSNNFPGNKRSLAYELGKIANQKVVAVVGRPSGKIAAQKLMKKTIKPKEEIKSTEKSEAPAPETKTVKTPESSLRKDFPKLIFSELTNELKILVIDRISLFNTAKEARKQLDEATTDEDKKRLTKFITVSMLENQQIWDELNHFQNTKKVLGKHPIFSQKAAITKLESMSRAELFSLKQNIPSYVSKAKKAIKENPNDAKLIKRKRALLETYAWKEKQVDRLLNM